jgi:hypothetical protein
MVLSPVMASDSREVENRPDPQAFFAQLLLACQTQIGWYF